MATKKRAKATQSAPRKKKRVASAAARATKKSAPRRAVKKTRARPAAKRAQRPAPRPAATASSAKELSALKTRFQREKSALEKRLTDTVREIGQLRHHEARAVQLERQVKERDEAIAQLRSQLSELRNREVAARDDDDAQPSLALGSRGHDLDEFEDEEVEPEEDDELI